MSTTTIPNNATETDFTFSQAHGTVMVIAWMIFASTGILFARYGRVLHVGRNIKIFGEIIWFQIHRIALSLAAIATLLGFFLILAETQATWVSVSDGGHLLAHSILGVIIVCCAQIQVYMALFRCHPDGRFRFIFNWMHRLTGLLAFFLSIPTIFLVIFVLPSHHDGLVAILSLWSAWVVIIVIIFEIIEYRSRTTLVLSTDNTSKQEITTENGSQNVEIDKINGTNIQSFSKIKFFFFCLHIVIAIGLAIPLIVLIWTQ